MKKRLLPMLAVLLLSVSILGMADMASAADDDVTGSVDEAQVELTEKQQKKLAKMYQKLFKQKKKLINQYVEYDVITAEKGEKIISHMQKYLQELEKNGFIPDCKHGKHGGKDKDRDKTEQE